MSNKKTRGIAAHIIKAQEDKPVQKAENPTQLSKHDNDNSSDWITHPLDMRGLREMVKHSSILPQCIRAYKNNIAGFGIGIQYKEDVEESEDMKTEWTRLQDAIALLTIEKDTKELFEDIIETREIYGITYVECVRNVEGLITTLELIKDTPSIDKTKPLEPYIEVDYNYNGRIEKKRRKFCKYRQMVGSKTVYFKEVGDPRIMDRRDGKYLEEDGTLDKKYQANEIVEFSIGTEPYGEVRWIGQILGIDGSQKAEGLNNNYFENGRHTPMLIMIKNGTLTEESFTKLQSYMNGIKGQAGQHAFMILEAEGADNTVDYGEGVKAPEIEIKDLASILQKDELFQDYLENNRRRIQSSFQLPDLYTGYTTDFNRATSQTAMEVTEKQVWQPERKSVSWTLNNKILNSHNLQHVEACFLEPDITNPDDLAKILNVTERAGGLPPNKAKEITYSIMGESAEPYEGEWADLPLAYARSMAAQTTDITEQITKQILKAQDDKEDEIVAVLKSVRSLLRKQSREGS